MLSIDRLKRGHLIPCLYLWLESLFVKYEKKSPSILLSLTNEVVLKLLFIAYRSPRDGRKLEQKRAIRRLISIQLVKSGLFTLSAIFLFVYFFEIVPFYINIQSVIFVFIATNAIFILLDWILWNADLEESLLDELKMREAEVGLNVAVSLLSLEKGTDMGLVQPLTADEFTLMHAESVSKAQAEGLDVRTHTRNYWEQRLEIKDRTSDIVDENSDALREYLEEDR